MRFRAFAAASGLAFSQLISGCLVYGEDLLGTGGGGGSGGTTTGTTTPSETTTSSETGMPCTVPEDCPDPGSPCKARLCTSGACAVEIAAANTELPDPEPGNCLGVICDSAGGSIEVEDSKDIPDDMNAVHGRLVRGRQAEAHPEARLRVRPAEPGGLQRRGRLRRVHRELGLRDRHPV